MLELKTYQRDTLDAFSHWVEVLKEEQKASETTIEHLKQVSNIRDDVLDDIRNYPKTAWKKLAENSGVAESAGQYVDRKDGANRSIPHICFKVPTGGGKNVARCICLGTAPSAAGTDTLDCAEQGYLRSNKGCFVEQGTPLP